MVVVIRVIDVEGGNALLQSPKCVGGAGHSNVLCNHVCLVEGRVFAFGAGGKQVALISARTYAICSLACNGIDDGSEHEQTNVTSKVRVVIGLLCLLLSCMSLLATALALLLLALRVALTLASVLIASTSSTTSPWGCTMLLLKARLAMLAFNHRKLVGILRLLVEC